MRKLAIKPGQICNPLSRVKAYDNLNCIEKFKKSTIKINKDTWVEYECLKQNNLLQ